MKSDLKTAAFMALMGLLALAQAQTTTVAQVNCPDGSVSYGRLLTTGQGSVTGTPDAASINLHVQATRLYALVAHNAGSGSVNATLAALAAQGINVTDPSTVTTTGPNVTPSTQGGNPNNGNGNGRQRPSSFTFTQDIIVNLVNVTSDVASNIASAAVSAGGGNVQLTGVTTQLSPSANKTALVTARQMAVADAMDSASVLAAAANATLGPITRLTDVSNPVQGGGAAANGGLNNDAQVSILNTSDTAVSVALEVALCPKAPAPAAPAPTGK